MNTDFSYTDLIGYAFALVALVIGWFELRQRRLQNNAELDLQIRRFEHEKEQMDRQSRWLEQQRIAMDSLSQPLADNLAHRLSQNVSWAVDAFDRAKMGPYGDTLFGDRQHHFEEEKKAIAEQFAPLLLERCKYLIESQNRRICLLIDSGTTLYPFFKVIAENTIKAYHRDETWITGGEPNLPASERSRLMIATNNLPGVDVLIRHGRPLPRNRYSDLAVHTVLLQGAPLPIFSCVTGMETEKAIYALHRDLTVIALVTGNWIRIRRSSPRCPVPMGRGAGHLESKQAFVDRANEVYVVAPLGKIFGNVGKDEVNPLLGFSEYQDDPERLCYGELDIGEQKANQVRLVTTSRSGGRLLSPLYMYLWGRLDGTKLTPTQVRVEQQRFVKANIGEAPHVFLDFQRLSARPEEEQEQEFPHAHTRRPDFLRLYTNLEEDRVPVESVDPKRNRPRVRCHPSTTAKLEWHNASYDAEVRDYTENGSAHYLGLGVVVDTAPEDWVVGTEICVLMDSARYRAQVCHRRRGAARQRVGLNLSN